MRLRLFLNTVLLITIAVMFTACGQVVQQNELAIVVKTMGERSTDAAETSEIYWGRRLPWGIGANPAVRHFYFPLGLQDYEFSERASFESPNPNAIETDCLGGHLSFDVNLQMEIDRTHLGKDNKLLAAMLLEFISDHQMRGYSGSKDILAKWAGEKLKQFVREPLAQYSLPRQAIDIMRNKAEMNKLVLDALNKRFNKYGLRFLSVGITSAIHVPRDQKGKMNDVVMKEYDNQALLLKDQKVMPLKTEIVGIEQTGLENAQNARNRGVTESIGILAAANQQRRMVFIDLLGPENYVTIEQMLSLTKALESGGSKISIVPSTLTFMGQPAQGTIQANQGKK